MAFCMNAPAEVLDEEEKEAVVNLTDREEKKDEEKEGVAKMINTRPLRVTAPQREDQYTIFFASGGRLLW